MAKTKVPFTKLGLKKLDEVKTLYINDIEIEVRQYLPIDEKLQFVSDVIVQSADGNNFLNPIKIGVFSYLNTVFYYTNITFTDKQKEDPSKLYDLLAENGIIDKVIAEIPVDEFQKIYGGAFECAQRLYEQLNSAKGIIDSIVNDYNETDLDASKIQEKIADPKNITLLKDVLEKLG